MKGINSKEKFRDGNPLFLERGTQKAMETTTSKAIA